MDFISDLNTRDIMVLMNDNLELNYKLEFWRYDKWFELELANKDGRYAADGISAKLTIEGANTTYNYSLEFKSEFETRIRLRCTLVDIKDVYHIIPCNIHGDNNLEKAEPGHFPNLTYLYPENISCSDYWEFRADRASHPLSILCSDKGVTGISVDPYFDAIVKSF